MNAELISIGTEILLGDIINTNSAFLARQLSQLGIDVYHQSVVGDNAARLKQAINAALSRSDIVLTTGGLGPTCDDVTKKTVAEMFGVPLQRHIPSEQKIKAYYLNRGIDMTPNNLLQADVPAGSTVFPNDAGFAPGVALSTGGKTVIMLPGPPSEMCPMFQNHLVPFLQAMTDSIIRSKTVNIFGLGESAVENALIDLMISSNNPTVAPYAALGEVKVRVSAKAADAAAADALIDPVINTIKEKLGGAVYGIDAESLQNVLVRELKNKRITAAAAESCTCGMVSAAITDIPGASFVFKGGICAYTNDSKLKLLGVKSDTLKLFGAVSEQTAKEMAKGSREVFGADIGVGVTGIAGPDGGTELEPVGLVYIAVKSKSYSEAKKLYLARKLANDRSAIRRMATLHALSLMLTAVLNA
ncbi:MAG: competence/damage-inducible protein A [Christensenellales bacterium]